MTKTDTRSLSPKAQEALRIRAVQACEAGEKPAHVAKTMGVSRQALHTWRKLYQEKGEKALRAKKRGRKRGGTLKPWQAAQIAQAVIHHHPDQLRLPGFLWTREGVGELIYQRFGIRLSRWTVGRYMRRWGFTPQKPARRALEQDPSAVRRWLHSEYPEILRRAVKEGARILWGDEMGLRSDDQVGRSWGKRGQTPIVPKTGSRFGCSVISAISNQGALYFMVFSGTLKADVFIEFLRRMLKHCEEKIVLIVDRHPVHRSKKVRSWVASRQERLHLIFLPAYSPELNPDEYLNQDVKNAMGKRRADTKSALLSQTRSTLRSRQRKPHKVQNYFQAKHVRYAAD